MRKRKKSEEGGFNVWRSYSDMMAGVLLLFILIMCVTLFQAQKSYNESIKERDDKIALQEQYTAEILAQQSELDEKNSKLSSQDEQLDKQKKLLAELAAQLKEQQASLDEKTSLLATQQKKIDNIIGVKADVIEALQKEFSKNNVSVDIDAQTGAQLTVLLVQLALLCQNLRCVLLLKSYFIISLFYALIIAFLSLKKSYTHEQKYEEYFQKPER